MTAHDYPLLRASVEPQYADLPARDLDRLVQSIYGTHASAEDVEGLLQDIGSGISSGAQAVGRFAGKVAPAVGKALPSLASGAMTGAAVGGPWGALVGAGVGLTGGLLSQSRNRSVSSIGGGLNTASNLISTVRGGGSAGALGSLASLGTGVLGGSAGGQIAAAALRGGQAQGGGSANALMGLLARPEVVQAISSGMLGQFGRRDINIAGQRVPMHQILSALSTVSQRAAHEAAEFDETIERTPAYAEAAAETLGIDADDAEGRTDALLTLLALSPSIWMQRPPVNVSIMPSDPYHPGGETWDGAVVENGMVTSGAAWAMVAETGAGDETEISEDDEWDEWDEDWGGEDIGAWENGAPMDWLSAEFDEDFDSAELTRV